MKAIRVVIRDPFRPMHGREYSEITRRRRIYSLAPKTDQPFVAILNGEAILRAHWSRQLQDGDALAFVVLPQGAGGGSNPLNLILTLGLMAFGVPYFAEGAALAGYGATEIMLVKAGVMMAGMALINALVPPPKPSAASSAASIAAASPTYSLQAQGNQARLGAPIPVLYGQHQVFPDFAAQPYEEFSGNDQYLFQLFCVTQGLAVITSLNIADAVLDAAPVNDGGIHTASGSFTDITYQIVPPGGTVTLFPSRVSTSTDVSGQEATTGVALGPFPANPSGTAADTIAIDVVFSRGLYYANDNGSLGTKSVSWTVQAAPIDSVGTITGGWFNLGLETFSAATTTPQRKSYRYGVTPGRYTVKLTRTDTKDTNTRAGHELDWVGLRTYIPGSQNYGNVTLIAMRMKATDQLSATSARKINCIAQRHIQVWNGTAWSTQFTRSIAWAFADAAMATDYGAGLPASRLDIAGLLALDAVWTARGDHYDGVFDSLGTCWEALTQIARAGRALPVYQGGILYAVRDSVQTLPVALFTPRNIARGTFKLDYTLTTDATTDSVEVTYFDSAVWSWQVVTATLPGDTDTNPAKVQLQGVVSRDQAWREGMYMAACNRYRRRLGTLRTEMEGLIPRVGDLIAVSHDMPSWGASGDVVAHTGIATGSTLTLSEPVATTGTHWLALSAIDGSVSGPWQVTATAGSPAVVLIDTITSFTWPDDYTEERARYAIGSTSSTVYVTARVLTIKPATAETIDVSFVVESGSVHTADGTGSAPYAPVWQLPGVPSVPTVSGLVVQVSPTDQSRVMLSWQPAAGAIDYLVEQSPDGVTWTRCAEVSTTSWTGPAMYGAGTQFKVAGVGLSGGGWSSTVNAPATAPAAVSTLSATGGLFQIGLSWTFPDTQDYTRDRVEIWANTSNNRGTAYLLTMVPVPAVVWVHPGVAPGQTWYYWARAVNKTGGISAWYPASSTAGVYASASTDPSLLLTQLKNAVGMPQLAPELSQPISMFPAAAMQNGIVSLQNVLTEYDHGVAIGGLTTQYTSLAATVAALPDVGAAITTEETARISADSALASSITTLTATVSGNTSAISSEATTRAGADSALSSSISTVSARLDTGDFAAVKTSATASASAVTGLQAQYVLSVQTVSGGALRVAGMQLASGSGGSSIVFEADKLLFVMPDGSGTPKQAVIVGNVNGVTTVGIDGSVIVDGSIVARSIAANTITASQIAAGTISATNMAANSITAANGAIANLTVGTLTIIDQAVNTLVAANGGPTWFGGTGEAINSTDTLTSVALTSTGKPCVVSLAVTIPMHLYRNGGTIVPGVNWAILRNGTNITGWSPVPGTINPSTSSPYSYNGQSWTKATGTSFGYSFTDTGLSNGVAYTYQLVCQVASLCSAGVLCATQYGLYSLTAQEVKK